MIFPVAGFNASPAGSNDADQVTAGPFGHAAADRVARLQVFVVTHLLPVVLQVADRRQQRLATRAAQSVLGQALAESADDVADPALQQITQAGLDELLGRTTSLGVEAVGRRPESLHHVEQIEDSHRLGEVDALRLPQRAFAVHQADHRTVMPQVAPVQVVVKRPEDRVLGRERFAVEVSAHLGPDVLVTRLGAILAALVAKHLIEDVVGGAHERFDAVDGADAGHLLLVRLLPLGPAMVALGAVHRRAFHRHPLAVGGDDQDRPFLHGGRRLDRAPERNYGVGKLLVHMLQRSRTQPQPQQGLERFGGLGEGSFQGEPLGPVLDDIGEVPRGQSKRFVQGRAFDLLALTRAVDDARDRQFSEDRDVATVVRLGEALDRPALVGLGGRPEVAVAVLRDEEIQEGQAEVEQLRHEVALDLIDPPVSLDGRMDGIDELPELGLGLEEGLFLVHDHGGSLGRGEQLGLVTDVLPQGSHFFHPLSS